MSAEVSSNDVILSPNDMKEDEATMSTPSPHAEEQHEPTFEEDCSSHQFYGPALNNPSARALHSTRRLDNAIQPPKFISSSSKIDVPTTSILREESVCGNMIEVIFQEEKLGFGTKVELDSTSGLVCKVQVEYVDAASPAARAGVAKDDFLISVNSEPIEATMTEDDVVKLIQQAEKPKAMLFLRINEVASPQKQEKKEVSNERNSLLPKQMLTKLQSARSLTRAGTINRLQSCRKLVDTALGRKSGKVNEDSFCDGCGMNPIIGDLWTCNSCSDYTLCSTCYERGIHGMENTDAMKAMNEATIQDKLKKRCKQFNNAFLLSLRRDICKGRLDKFEYMGSWIADIVTGTPATRITVRGIEIPQLSPDSRQHFVGMLMPLASNRTDIEVHIEWLNDEKSEEGEEMEKLRIWISDKKTRVKSPFA